MTDKREFLERAQSFSEYINGRHLTSDEIVDSFTLYSPEYRISMLYELDGERKDEVSRADLRDEIRKQTLLRQLKHKHQVLMKAGR